MTHDDTVVDSRHCTSLTLRILMDSSFCFDTINFGLYISIARLTICRMRNRRFSKDIRAINFRFRKEDPQKVDKVCLFQF